MPLFQRGSQMVSQPQQGGGPGIQLDSTSTQGHHRCARCPGWHGGRGKDIMEQECKPKQFTERRDSGHKHQSSPILKRPDMPHFLSDSTQCPCNLRSVAQPRLPNADGKVNLTRLL